jgi:hypothetical protein
MLEEHNNIYEKNSDTGIGCILVIVALVVSVILAFNMDDSPEIKKSGQHAEKQKHQRLVKSMKNVTWNDIKQEHLKINGYIQSIKKEISKKQR